MQAWSTTAAARRVCVVGLGYIGLPTAAVLTRHGFHVHGVDVNEQVLRHIRDVEIPECEPGLREVVAEAVRSGRLTLSTTPEPADVFLLCVPTPVTGEHLPDLGYVRRAAASIRPVVDRGNLVILESTSPPGTTRHIVAREAVPSRLVAGQDVSVAYGPERVLPSRLLHELVENDRIVGGLTPECARAASHFYASFVRGQIMSTTDLVAEMVKLVENSFRDVNLAFANEVSMLADFFEVDVHQVIELANRHPRVDILKPGPGVGGHCISVDPWFLAHASPGRSRLIRTARQVNDEKPRFVVRAIRQRLQSWQSQRVGCLGLAYKADVDDVRESPSLEIVRQLRSSTNVEVLACDPLVQRTSFDEFPLCDLESVLDYCDTLVLLTDHQVFRNVTAEERSGKRWLDTRGCWSSTETAHAELERRAA